MAQYMPRMAAVSKVEAEAIAGGGSQETLTNYDAFYEEGTSENRKPAPRKVEFDGFNFNDGNGRNETTVKAEAPAPPPEQDQPERSRLKVVLIMLALGMAVFLAAIDVTIVTTALPTISTHFHSASGYTWIGAAFLLANSAATPFWGKVSDVFGRKPVLLIANAIFFIGSLLAGVSTSIGMLIVARAIQGVGGGGLITLVNICISDMFSMRERGMYFGIIGMVWALASAIGPLLGGVFTEKLSWRWCFYINLPFDGASFLIIFIFLDLKTPKTPFWQGVKTLDWIGSLTIVGGTLMVLLGLEYGGVSFPWDSPTVICLLIFGVLTFVIFFLNEWKFAKYPVMPLRIFQYRSNLASLGVCFFHGFVFIAGPYYLPLYFQAVRGLNPLLSGVYSLPLAIALSGTSAATGIFIRKTGMYLPAIWFGMAVLTLGFGLFINFDAGSSLAKIIIYQIIAGIGVGPNFQSPLIALQTLLKGSDIAAGTATFGFIRQLAMSMSVVIGQVVFQNAMSQKDGQLAAAIGPQKAALLGGGNAGANVDIITALPPTERYIARAAFADSLQPMWIMFTCFSAVGLLVSFLISKQNLSQQHSETQTGLDAQQAAKNAGPEEHTKKLRGQKSVDTLRTMNTITTLNEDSHELDRYTNEV